MGYVSLQEGKHAICWELTIEIFHKKDIQQDGICLWNVLIRVPPQIFNIDTKNGYI